VNSDNLKNAVILINKPVGITSFDTVSRIKRLIKQKKIGHSGTLDKFASGLLVVCTGRATKLTRFFLESDKRYIADIKLGVSTDTCDINGEVVERNSIDGITSEDVFASLTSFQGELLQVPPSYSALKINGQRASDLVRKGKAVDLKKRKVNIYNIDINSIDLENGSLSIDVDCSKGTYIRSIARDLGESLGTGAHLQGLIRVKSGSFNLDDAVTLDELSDYVQGQDPGKAFIKTPVQALSQFNSIVLKDDVLGRVLNGGDFQRDDVLDLVEKGQNFFIILDQEKNLIAIADIDIDKWSIKYLNVFNT